VKPDKDIKILWILDFDPPIAVPVGFEKLKSNKSCVIGIFNGLRINVFHHEIEYQRNRDEIEQLRRKLQAKGYGKSHCFLSLMYDMTPEKVWRAGLSEDRKLLFHLYILKGMFLPQVAKYGVSGYYNDEMCTYVFGNIKKHFVVVDAEFIREKRYITILFHRTTSKSSMKEVYDFIVAFLKSVEKRK
jgi:hypothetical protein